MTAGIMELMQTHWHIPQTHRDKIKMLIPMLQEWINIGTVGVGDSYH